MSLKMQNRVAEIMISLSVLFFVSMVVSGLITGCASGELITGSTSQYGLSVSTVASDVTVTMGANLGDYVSTPVIVTGTNGAGAPLLVKNQCGEDDVISTAGSLTGNANSGSAVNPAVTLNVGRGMETGEAAKEQGIAQILAAAGGSALAANGGAAALVTALRQCAVHPLIAPSAAATTAAATGAPAAVTAAGQ